MELIDAERERLDALSLFEAKARLEGYLRVAGVDEAGRGPWAGPVVAAACRIPDGVYVVGADDSKKLSAKERYTLFQKIGQMEDLDWAVGIVESQLIDQLNILQATFRAMLIAVDHLRQRPDLLLIDGKISPPTDLPCWPIVRGDSRSQSIAVASVIAKQTRDALMNQYDEMWPMYGFRHHKGYGTVVHRKALKEHGPCPIHRRSFAPIRRSLNAS